MRLGLYGGSFDPIHFGHLEPVRQARQALALDRILYLPTATPPHKSRQLAPAMARYTMVELALLGEPHLYASDHEMDSGRTSYTVDTLEHFHNQLPEAQLFLILGGDSFLQLTSWKRWQRILELAELAILVRPGWRLPTVRDVLAAELQQALDHGRAQAIANAPVDVSSTEVRAAVASGSNRLADLVPPLVLDYIDKYQLYRNDSGTPT